MSEEFTNKKMEEFVKGMEEYWAKDQKFGQAKIKEMKRDNAQMKIKKLEQEIAQLRPDAIDEQPMMQEPSEKMGY